MNKTHTISILVQHKPGVLQRVSGLFTRRDFNIDSITVGATNQKNMARITITTKGNEEVLEQILKQLNKLIETIKVRELNPETTIRRELSLIKVKAPDEQTKSQIIQYVNIFRGNIVDITHKTIIVEITGTPQKIKALEKLLEPFGIKEISKTGTTAMLKGEN
ncbi:MAG: acetolactate synthase small subunit [Methanobacteriaceae archaeon]|nr:acetolactate synthase small subunit [Methanobacteriaceae archaeon]